jgi:beta-lactamase regulating signal transducer with metallopeptidase domain
METLVGSWFQGEAIVETMRFFVIVSLRVSILCLLAGAVTVGLRRSSAYTRKMIWVFALIGLVLIPPLSLLDPVVSVPLLPDLDSWGGTFSFMRAKGIDPGYEPGSIPEGIPGASNIAESQSSGGIIPPWSVFLLFVWLAGTAGMMVWFLFSRLYVYRTLRNAESVDDSWEALRESIENELYLRRAVRLYRSDRIDTAITTGVFRTAVVLPLEANEWSDTRRRLVLSHELAHVKRWDGLIELVASLAVALYWFNPLVWLAVSRLRIERERDCDNAVLNSGARPSDYASLLLDIAADLARSGRPVWQLSTISQGSNLKDRLLCILNPTVNRSMGNRRCAMKAVALVLAVILPLSLLGVWDSKAQEKEMKQEKQEKQEKQKKVAAIEKINAAWKEVAAREGSAAAAVAEAIDSDGIKAGMKKCAALMDKKSDKLYFKEEEFNTLGYRYLYNGEMDKAIGVFKCNVKNYPDSWNVYDSLGEAYAHKGDFELATKNYKKSLELNPENENGMKMLQKIEEKEMAEKECDKKEGAEKESKKKK